MFRKLPAKVLAAILFIISGVATQAHAQAVPGINPSDVKAGAYKVEPAHTRVLFSILHLGFSTFYGEFSKVSGSLNLSSGSVRQSLLDIKIPVDTIYTTSAKLDAKLQTAPWFNATQYPDMEFKSISIVRTGEKTATVKGNLTLRGVTKPETLDVTFVGAGVNPLDGKYTVGFSASGVVKRSDFGMDLDLPPAVGDNVTLILSAAFEHS